MQIWLRSSPDFSAKTLKDITDLAASFEIAGVKSTMKSAVFNVSENSAWVNSIRNKFEALKLFIEYQLDIIAITETKLDDSFLVKQFCIHGYNTPFRVDKSDNSGGILVRSNIPCREIASNLPKNVEGIFMETNIRNKKWLVFTGYNPKTEYIQTFLEQVNKSLN